MISGEFTINEVANANGAGQQKPSKKSAQARIEALKAAAVDVSNYFPMGEEMIVRVKDGVPTTTLFSLASWKDATSHTASSIAVGLWHRCSTCSER